MLVAILVHDVFIDVTALGAETRDAAVKARVGGHVDVPMVCGTARRRIGDGAVQDAVVLRGIADYRGATRHEQGSQK